MKNERQELLKLLTVRTETVKLDCLKNTNFKDMEFQLKEMNIAQNKEYNEILRNEKEGSFDKCMKYACKTVMIEPSFFTEDELKDLNGIAKMMMQEIFQKIPTIGMTVKEKKYYHSRVEEIAKKQVKENEKTKEKK